MRLLTLTAVMLLAAGPATAADPPTKVRAEVAAALALAGTCDCPSGRPARCAEVTDVLARVAIEIDRERAGPAVAPAPREKTPCDCAGAKCVECGPSCPCAPPAAVAPLAAPVATSPAPSCRWVQQWDARRGWVWVQTCR